MIHRTYLPAKNSQRPIPSQHLHIDTDNNLRKYIIKCNTWVNVVSDTRLCQLSFPYLGLMMIEGFCVIGV